MTAAEVTDRYARCVHDGVTVTVYASDGKVVVSYMKGSCVERETLDHCQQSIMTTDWSTYLDVAVARITR